MSESHPGDADHTLLLLLLPLPLPPPLHQYGAGLKKIEMNSMRGGLFLIAMSGRVQKDETNVTPDTRR